MKLTITLLLALLTTLGSWAQSTGNVVFFTAGGERFYAVVNGVRQNMNPETNLKISDLNQEWYKMTFIFEDTNIPALQDKSVGVQMGKETVYQLKQNKKGKWVIRLTSEAPLASAPSTGAAEIVYHSTPLPAGGTTTTNSGVTITESTPGVQMDGGSTTTTTTTTTTSSGVGTTDNVSINMGGMGIDMNVNINDGMGGTTIEESTTVTTTTSSSSSTTTTGGWDGSMDAGTETHTTYQESTTGGNVVASGGCAFPMDAGSFDGAKKSIANKSFEDSKMTVAKQIAKNNCLSANQVKELLGLFDFESTKLDFAKFAYDYTYDRNNYYVVNDAFEFESTIEELDEYISAR